MGPCDSVTARGLTDLRSLGADEDEPGPTLLAAAETDDGGNLEAGRREEELRLITRQHPPVCQHI